MDLYDKRWFVVARLIVLGFIILYSAPAIYMNSRLMFGQSAISERQAIEMERAAEMRARVKALEEAQKETRADRINERISSLESGMRSTERALRDLNENVALLSWTGNAILLGIVTFCIKEAIRAIRGR